MVCLEAKKKSDDKSQDAQAEIKLLEIMSNCNWEVDRTNMLSKISHIISKDYMCDTSKSQFIVWGAYLLEFLPKADKPAVIPPELKPKLPSEMFSIRIKVTNNVGKDEKKEKNTDEVVTVVDDGQECTKSKVMSEDESKRYNMRLQKKLIDKIKFAERLRNLIIAEEKKGVTASKFSVSREGIEKALKKYKTQLWKACTGNSNLTIQQLKQALHAAKSSAGGSNTAGNKSRPVSRGASAAANETLSTSTLERIQTNQGVTVVTATGQTMGHHSFINLANHQQGVASSAGASIKSVGNLVIHGSVPTHNLNQGQGLIDNIENVKKSDGPVSSVPQAPKGSISTSKINQISNANSGLSPNIYGSDVVFMPLDKNIHPSQLPPGAKIAVVQPILDRDGSPVPFAGQPPAGGGPFRAVVLPNASQMSGFPVTKPFLNPAVTSLAATRPVITQNFQGSSVSGMTSSTSGPQSVPRMPGPVGAVHTSGNCVFVNGTGPGMRAGFPCPQYVATVTLPSSSVSGFLPLKIFQT
ncbi:uncharacterized protein LOC128547953 [Mercenaria mercenaria]|uniref:uncharacterized protein LOC128547953 n=1 Tax=Mercenaria mercenaria TaxID=6596 RepID=UPI00234EB2CB|nr:uncharacterized protein LOC128547953 [Mercenaria mercenaria]